MTLLDHLATGTADLRAMSEDELADLAERLSGRPVPGVRWTERQFADWSFGRFDAEWADGEVILMAPVSDAHDDLDTWLITLLRTFVEARRFGVIRHNMFVRFPGQRRRRVPDLMFISEANRGRIRRTVVEGAPDLIIEIVSPDSQNRDRRDKYLEYAEAGVREYWLIDPVSQTLDAYALRGRKYLAIRPAEGHIGSKVLRGFFLRPDWLFGEACLPVAVVLKEFDL
jgi:Uma2 family endonuclease